MPYVRSNRYSVDQELYPIGNDKSFTKITDMKILAATEERGAGSDGDQKPGTPAASLRVCHTATLRSGSTSEAQGKLNARLNARLGVRLGPPAGS